MGRHKVIRCIYCGSVLDEPGVPLYVTQRKIFNFLRYQQRRVGKVYLKKHIWPERHMTDALIHRHVNLLRFQLKNTNWTVSRAPYKLEFSRKPKLPATPIAEVVE